MQNFTKWIRLFITMSLLVCTSMHAKRLQKESRQLIKVAELDESTVCKGCSTCYVVQHDCDEQRPPEQQCIAHGNCCPAIDPHKIRYRQVSQSGDFDPTLKSPIVGPGFGFGERSSSFQSMGLRW